MARKPAAPYVWEAARKQLHKQLREAAAFTIKQFQVQAAARLPWKFAFTSKMEKLRDVFKIWFSLKFVL